MKYFSERKGYVKPSDVIITDTLTIDIINAISSCFTYLKTSLDNADEDAGRADEWMGYQNYSFYQMGLAFWTKYLKKRALNYTYSASENYPESNAFQKVILDKEKPWHIKLDAIEFAIEYMEANFNDEKRCNAINDFIDNLNERFESLNFGYRIVNGMVTDIITPVEIKEVEQAEETSNEVVANHLKQALVLYSQKPNPDYRNSIKEAISSVEALMRFHTGENTFGPAYTKIKSEITIHPQIQTFIQKVYDYTNQEDTGIRHSKVVADTTYLPSADEAKLMLVICSAIVNYFNSKFSKIV